MSLLPEQGGENHFDNTEVLHTKALITQLWQTLSRAVVDGLDFAELNSLMGLNDYRIGCVIEHVYGIYWVINQTTFHANSDGLLRPEIELTATRLLPRARLNDNNGSLDICRYSMLPEPLNPEPVIREKIMHIPMEVGLSYSINPITSLSEIGQIVDYFASDEEGNDAPAFAVLDHHEAWAKIDEHNSVVKGVFSRSRRDPSIGRQAYVSLN